MKSETPSFVLELQLKTTSVQEAIILTRLEAGRQMYNACLGEALKRLDLIRQSREFQKVIVLPEGKEPRVGYELRFIDDHEKLKIVLWA